MERLSISPDFTIEDIRKVKDYLDAEYTTMTTEERRADIERRADSVRQKIAEARANNLQKSGS